MTKSNALTILENALHEIGVQITVDKNLLHFSSEKKSIKYLILDGEHQEVPKSTFALPLDILLKGPEKIAANVRNRLGLNTRVHGRDCAVKKINKTEARLFLDKYHLMNSTDSAYSYGLFKKDELLSVATFSKGRKMNRLPEDKRSFELIRFCTVSGITVTGGLSKLLKHFILEKAPGDIMTYVDAQLSDGNAFTKSGFTIHSRTRPRLFLINKKTRERKLMETDEVYDDKNFYRFVDEGNLKLVYCVI